MRDYFAQQPDCTGTVVATLEGDGPGHMLSVTPDGAQLEPVYPTSNPYYPDKDVYVQREALQGSVYRVGR